MLDSDFLEKTVQLVENTPEEILEFKLMQQRFPADEQVIQPDADGDASKLGVGVERGEPSAHGERRGLRLAVFNQPHNACHAKERQNDRQPKAAS